ncbi:MAG: glutathione S-transferase N-terminal domain-containing protein, partial [Burkholderiales bacterium]|nr:glutathione S-transferase N-terminal domain-containing protein [Burkholderiales bacterium]
MIKLYQFEPAFGLPNASPFCMKLETYLRMAGLPFEIAPNANIMKAPKGKMPYIEDNGRAIADSSLIIEYLRKTYGDRLDAKLTS